MINLSLNLSNYRDYLVNIWVDNAIWGASQNGTTLGQASAIKIIEDRFHQDFTTNDTQISPANEILVSIVTDILKSPKQKYGFGITSINAQSPGQTSRQYLNYLISLSGHSVEDFGNQYRINLVRSDDVLSSPVQENIYTIQRFFTDSFQCDLGPLSIIPNKLQGMAPFFLEYDEWVKSKSFYPENFYQIKNTVGLFDEAIDSRTTIQHLASSPYPVVANKWKLVNDAFNLYDIMSAGHSFFNRGEYGLALNSYNEVYNSIDAVLNGFTHTAGFLQQIENEFLNRKKKKIDNFKDLQEFMDIFNIRKGFSEYSSTDDWLNENQPRVQYGLVYLRYYILIVCLGETHLAMGNFTYAVNFYSRVSLFHVAHADADDEAGYDYTRDLYFQGELPYTNALKKYSYEYPSFVENLGLFIEDYTHSMEKDFILLAHGNVILEWADTLYRSNDSSNIARARELYKAVLWLWDTNPSICPDGGSGGIQLLIENPAILSQKRRARLGFSQIEQGLNYYGYTDDLVPILRYRPLKDAADRFVNSAKAAQTDFLDYTEKLEKELLEDMKNMNMLKKALIQAKIASEQANIAQTDVNLAQMQIDQINQAIQDKEQEIADHDSLFSQFSDYIGGMINLVKGLPDDTKSSITSGLGSAAGINEMKGQGFLGLGEAGSVLAGFGVFEVGSYITLSSMADAANKRTADLTKLREQILPTALKQLDQKKQQLQIAFDQQSIVNADVDLAQSLISFQTTRFLNEEFWSGVATIMKRVLRRYLELSAKMAWFAERALAYEQDREINIIQFDYFPISFQDITGADVLQLDLAQLEATNLYGIKETIPVKHTYSLARDFPLQFGQLKKSGQCTFQTNELPLSSAYLGVYGYRIKNITVTINNTQVTNPIRGLLTNHGASLISRINDNNDMEMHVSMRPTDAYPISEFRLSNDMEVYGLPDEALLPFEGSGVETIWSLEFPSIANPYGLDSVIDILLTFDLRAYYSPELYKTKIQSIPQAVQRMVFVSANRYNPKSIADLQGGTNLVKIAYHMDSIGLSSKEANRKVKNIVLFLIGGTPLTFKAKVSSTVSSTSTDIVFDKSMVMSNVLPLSQTGSSPSPLNKFVDQEAAQKFILTIDKGQNPGIDFTKVTDVIFGVEYSAQINS